jgi:hypothetical protein
MNPAIALGTVFVMCLLTIVVLRQSAQVRRLQVQVDIHQGYAVTLSEHTRSLTGLHIEVTQLQDALGKAEASIYLTHVRGDLTRLQLVHVRDQLQVINADLSRMDALLTTTAYTAAFAGHDLAHLHPDRVSQLTSVYWAPPLFAQLLDYPLAEQPAVAEHFAADMRRPAPPAMSFVG